MLFFYGYVYFPPLLMICESFGFFGTDGGRQLEFRGLWGFRAVCTLIAFICPFELWLINYPFVPKHLVFKTTQFVRTKKFPSKPDLLQTSHFSSIPHDLAFVFPPPSILRPPIKEDRFGSFEWCFFTIASLLVREREAFSDRRLERPTGALQQEKCRLE